MKQPIVGILGGGQLGKMLAMNLHRLNIKTFILDPTENPPCASMGVYLIKGDFLDYEAVLSFGRTVDILTIEIEHVNTQALKQLEKEGKKIYPASNIIALIQDKGKQKIFYQKNKIPSADFSLFENEISLKKAVLSKKIEFPFIQKLRKMGYDGKGVRLINSKKDLKQILKGSCLIEQKIEIHKEFSMIVARNNKGEIKIFPAVEMIFDPKANLLDSLFCPASLKKKTLNKASQIASKLAKSLKLNGILAIEFFLDQKEIIYVNEIAPRPHNSGHHTIESLYTSQYDQLSRILLGFPLGNTGIKMPSVMINILGNQKKNQNYFLQIASKLSSISGCYVYLYGKENVPYRKLGHVTLIDKNIKKLKQKTNLVKKILNQNK